MNFWVIVRVEEGAGECANTEVEGGGGKESRATPAAWWGGSLCPVRARSCTLSDASAVVVNSVSSLSELKFQQVYNHINSHLLGCWIFFIPGKLF